MSKRNPFVKMEERAIRHAVSMNLTNQQIADSLGISTGEVARRIKELGLTDCGSPHEIARQLGKRQFNKGESCTTEIGRTKNLTKHFRCTAMVTV